MQEPLKPENEDLRLGELDSFDILDSPTEAEYDEITLLASTICKTPIALISLIDSDRQWFKSHHGLDARETPRNISFCGHAINQDELFEVSNALTDERFSDNPLTVGDPRVVFYAGQPLISEKGYKVGTLCVIDHAPRKLSEEQKKAMNVLAKHVIAQMELRRSNKKLKESLAQIESQKEELVESSKMKTLGIMAGGVAHEINNPLSIISLYSGQMKKSLEQNTFVKDKLIYSCDKIDETVMRITDIVKALLNISRDSSKDFAAEFKLHKAIEDTLMLCSEKAKDTQIEIKVESDYLDRSVFFNSGELTQVMMNLISNSIDAVEEQDEKWIKILVSDEREFMKVSCIDSGKGIYKDNIENLMDPFFTTKDPGKGTGLGLSISKKIMNLRNGNLVYDKNFPNTKFDILIPKVKK